MAQQARAVRTRNTVLEAAAEVFARQGFEAATIAEILTEAKVTKGALYFHFASKEDLARGVLRHAVTETVQHTVKLQALVDTTLLLAYRLPREPILRGAARLAADQGAGDFFGSPWPLWTEISAGLLTEAKRKSEVFEHIDPTDIARVLVGTFTGLQLVALATGDGDDLIRLTARSYELMLPGIAVPGILGRIDTSPERGQALYEQTRTPEPPTQTPQTN